MKNFEKKEDAWAYAKECSEFKDYPDIKEYIEDIVTLLVYSTWHYTEIQAREVVEERMAWVEKFFKDKVPADDAYVDIGYYGG
jgi:hypothetical protein